MLTKAIPSEEAEAGAVWREQRAAFEADAAPVAAERRARLTALERMLLDHAAAISAAISADFGHRPATETRVLELFPSLEAIRHARRNVARWMRPDKRNVSIWFLPGAAEVRYQPLGVVGVIAPWNYPLYLAVGPLVSALAAGNRVMVKPSEYTPAFSVLFAKLVAKTFPRDLVHVVTGGVDAARDDAVRYINRRDRPLALYVFDDDRARRDDLLARTASGGVTINDTILHVGQDDLPFGGVGPSGMGRYHGPEGFRTFSQVRSVFRQRRFSSARLLYPPYGGALARKILKLMIRD